MIEVLPAPWHRREFARWAIAQTPKIRTVAQNTFGVPDEMFADAPEELLIGAMVDGHRYVSPVEDEEQAQAAAVVTVGGVPVDEWVVGVPGRPLPPVPDSAYGPDSVPLPPPDFAPLEDAPADDADGDNSDSSDSGPDLPAPEVDASAEPQPEGVFPCPDPDCEREFTTERGSETHYRMVHTESRS